jgi:hypothetical protein
MCLIGLSVNKDQICNQFWTIRFPCNQKNVDQLLISLLILHREITNETSFVEESERASFISSFQSEAVTNMHT